MLKKAVEIGQMYETSGESLEEFSKGEDASVHAMKGTASTCRKRQQQPFANQNQARRGLQRNGRNHLTLNVATHTLVIYVKPKGRNASTVEA